MVEKDRFGDKLRDKEKAEEDRYFAQQDRAKLEKLKVKEPRNARLGLCPRCGTELNEKDHSGVSIDECLSCGGIWLDAGELSAIEQRDTEGWMSRWIRSLLEGRA
ncbi:MAG: zf-TFIIB domain-containing protein [Candidatus Binatia bacterium]